MEMLSPELVVAQDLPPPWSSLAAPAVVEQHAHLHGSRSQPSPSPSPSPAGSGDRQGAPSSRLRRLARGGWGAAARWGP
ncbi:hypothetical protein E2562_014763 [Oryza meyeriana var. granulata]|uniref:Uncharacterized protein n=1 Tax=Oryza meyeriana var. granulata TaxID=110450 RepID=A0A6G1BKX2_9ORYZ|nr:hypothetical protein E2562_014763 [Oryza meyeriana var. granulata]